MLWDHFSSFMSIFVTKTSFSHQFLIIYIFKFNRQSLGNKPIRNLTKMTCLLVSDYLRNSPVDLKFAMDCLKTEERFYQGNGIGIARFFIYLQFCIYLILYLYRFRASSSDYAISKHG